MEPVPLDPRSYGGTYKLVGGDVSLDLVNTVSWPGTEREHDWFDPPSNITRWARATGLIDARTQRRLDGDMGADPSLVSAQVSAVVAIRATLRDVLAPLARGERPTKRALRALNGYLGSIAGRRLLDPRTLRWRWLEPATPEEAVAPAVFGAAELVSEVVLGRLRCCPACDWLFLDATRNGSRRWCDMADCGSRNKARRYYYRHKPGS